MSSINEIILIPSNDSLSIEHKQLSCVFNMQHWFITHFFVARLIEFFLHFYIMIPLIFILTSLFDRYLDDLIDSIDFGWRDTTDRQVRYSYSIIVLKKEMILILIYVLIAFLYSWFKLKSVSDALTYQNLLKWIIEVSFAPQVIFTTFALCYVEFGFAFFDLYFSSYVILIMLKVPLFILMRYAETEPNFFINRLQIVLFNVLCYRSLE
jgi:hypothetical protein